MCVCTCNFRMKDAYSAVEAAVETATREADGAAAEPAAAAAAASEGLGRAMLVPRQVCVCRP
jgi:hypothetical protein